MYSCLISAERQETTRSFSGLLYKHDLKTKNDPSGHSSFQCTIGVKWHGYGVNSIPKERKAAKKSNKEATKSLYRSRSTEQKDARRVLRKAQKSKDSVDTAGETDFDNARSDSSESGPLSGSVN